jgi:cysteine-rich repeat protein
LACGDDEPLGGEDSGAASGGGNAATGGGAGAGPDAGGDSGSADCGNGILEPGEECDDGNLVNLDGCEAGCRFGCVAGDPARDRCSDDNACNGEETCDVDHRCKPGTPLTTGDACGSGRVCVGELCVLPSCGDGQIQPGEECDDGDSVDGDGCDRDCRWSCVATDAARNCSPADACLGSASCDSTTHVCSPRTPLADQALCAVQGASGYCKDGACRLAVCGDGVPEPGELCDDGNTNDTDGCRADCTYTCTQSSDCDDASPCTSDVCDEGTHTCLTTPDLVQDGEACEVSSVEGRCTQGKCVPLTCGDGNVDAGEQCDTAGASSDGGCGTDCRYACQVDLDCSDKEPCSGVETCVAVESGKRCQSGTPLAERAVCQTEPRRICVQASCRLSLCGDSVVDAGRGEQCEPPGTASCTASCMNIVCGDGVIAGAEHCDDGNRQNLDGCDAECRYESVYRATAFTIMRGSAPSFCVPTANRLGNAFSQAVSDSLRSSLNSDIDAGGLNLTFQWLGLDDLTGVSDPSLEIGVIGARLDPGYPLAWQPSAIDAWFLANPESVDAAGRPRQRLKPASIQARILTAGPTTAAISVTFEGRAAVLEVRDMRVRVRIDDPPAPDVPAPPPAALAPGLKVFPSYSANQSDLGICGSVTVRSLANIDVPLPLTDGITACSASCSNSRAYTACAAGENPSQGGCHSLLDVLVGGCRLDGLCSELITATQPDVAAEGSTPRTLTVDANGYVPAAQTQNNADGYSMYVQINANRAHLTGIANP